MNGKGIVILRSMVITAALFFAARAGAEALSPENYLPNPGFEEGLKYWELRPCDNGVITLDDKVKHSGKYSLRFDYKKDADPRLGSYVWAANQFGAILTPGKPYTMSGWIKIAGVPSGKSGPIGYLCPADGRLGCSQRVDGNTNPAKDDGWVFVSFQYKVVESAVAHQLRCQCHAVPDGMAGTIWFDDLKLEEGDKPSAFREDWVDVTEFYSREANIPWLPLPVDYRASTEIVTPHLELAKPYAGGPLRLLWAGFYNNARIACELAERGDFALDSVVFNGSSIDVSGVRTIHEKCIQVFRERLGTEPKLEPDKAPQVLVIEQGTLELLNKNDRAAILDRVRQGMGCVVLLGPIHVRNHPGAVATPKIKELMDAAEKMQDPGHGHVLTALNLRQSPLWSQGTFGIESFYSDIINTVCRSVNRTPVPLRPTTVPEKPQAGEPWKVTVLGTGAVAQVRVVPDLPASDSDSIMGGHGVGVSRNAVAEASADLAEGATSATLALPPLPGGAYVLEARLFDKDKRVLDWSLSKFAIASPVTIAKLDVGGAAFTTANQPLNAVCTIKNDSAPIEGASVSAKVIDPLGRLLARSAPVPVPLKQGETPCSIPVALSHAELCSAKLLVEVKDKEKTLAQSEAWLSTEKFMPRLDFNVGPYDDYNMGARDLGADIVVHNGRPDLGLRPYPWINLLGAIGEDSSICDPAVLEKAKKYVILAAITNSAPLHIIGCILHDELNDYGFRSKVTEHDIAFFRQYLKETYKNLDALNASWGAAYKDWGEINTEPTKINFVTQADRNAAPWADWHAASEQAAHRFYAALDDAVRQADPGARIGPSGTRNTSGVNGTDWWLLTKDFRSVSLYDGIHGEMFRSFATPEHMITRWSHLNAMGDADGIRTRIWRDLLLQRTGTPTYGGRYSNLFFPDYRPKPGALSFFEELAAIRGGYGRLILGAKRDDADVAIFYSPACYRAQIVQTKRNEYYVAAGAYNNSLTSLSGALNDLRIGSHFIAYEQVSRGDLKPEAPKALFLWGALALSEAEAAAIRKYASDGGVVIADQEPGLYDEHCHKLPQGRLHDLFTGTGGPVREVGKGKAMLLSGMDANYMKLVGQGVGGEAAQTVKTKEGGAFAAKLRAVLTNETSSVAPGFDLTDDQNNDLAKDVATFGYVDGPARYVAVLISGKHGETRKARLTFKGTGHVYDCRAGKYLGRAGPLAVVCRVATANLFALLPGRVKKLDLTVPKKAIAGQPFGFSVRLKSDPQTVVRRVLRAQLKRPDGKSRPVDTRIFEMRDRSLIGTVATALNDPVGRWTLTVTDAATGVAQTAAIEITAP